MNIILFKFGVGVLSLLLSLNWIASVSTGKIHPDLIRSFKVKPLVNIFISFNTGTTEVLDKLSRANFTNRGDKLSALYNALSTNAAHTQKNVLELLKSPQWSAKTKVHSFWITNQVYIEGAQRSLIDILSSLEEVGMITEEEIILLVEPAEADQTQPPHDRLAVIAYEWGIEKIQAPAAWEIGGNGEGAVVGIIDTGARYTHEAIKNSYRGGDFSWYNPLAANSQFPVDGNGHGTHCTGTITGSLGIGVAPGAKWISCKAFSDSGVATRFNFFKSNS